jgi:hypothetical protein
MGYAAFYCIKVKADLCKTMQTQQQIISIISEYQYMDSGGTVFLFRNP